MNDRTFAFTFLTSPQTPLQIGEGAFSPPSKLEGGWEGGLSESPRMSEWLHQIFANVAPVVFFFKINFIRAFVC